MPFFSIQLNSNRPRQIVVLFDNIEATAYNPSDIEVLLHIDKGDTVMEELVAREQARRSFHLRILQTDLVKGYATLWMPLNPLWKMTSPDVYFVINISDEMLFETKGWDTIVRRYEGYYPDHIFRLRGSKYRFRNYTDFWECGFAPDSLAFYTRRWLELSGDWNPCLGPDSFQQSVAFYLFTSDPFSRVQFNRDIALTELRFIGEGAGIGLEGRARYKQIIVNNRAWFILMSHRMQQEARRRAMRMKAHMIAYAAGGGSEKYEVTESGWRRHFTIISLTDRSEIARVKYGLSRLRIGLTNLLRMRHVLYYAGGGKRALNYPAFGLFLMMTTYLPKGVDMLTWIMDTRCARERFKTRLRLIIRYPVRQAAAFLTRSIRYCVRGAKYLARLHVMIRRRMIRDETQYSTNYLVIRIPIGRAILGIATSLDAGMLRARRVISPYVRHILMPIKPFAKIWTGRFRKLVGRHVKALPNIRISIPYPQSMARRFTNALIRPVTVAVNGCFSGVEWFAACLSKAGGAVRAWLQQSKAQCWERIDSGAPSGPKAQPTGTVFSIQINSSHPDTILDTLNSIELMADAPDRIEVIIRIPAGDAAMKTLIMHEQAARRIRLRYLETYPMSGFEDQWKVANVMFQMTDPDAYFVAFIGDGIRFETKGWDTLLMQYIGYYPDHIFRVRASKYRFRNYRDYWECGSAPDSLTFHTRPWLAIQSGSSPCPGPAALQQCVSYYLFRADPFSHVQYHRDIAAPFVAFSGEGSGLHAEGDDREKRLPESRRKWLSLVSHAMQEDAKRRASHLKAAIIRHAARDENGPVSLVLLESPKLKQIRIEHEDGKLVEVLSWRLSRRAIRFITFFRTRFFRYYSGDGRSFPNSSHNALASLDYSCRSITTNVTKIAS